MTWLDSISLGWWLLLLGLTGEIVCGLVWWMDRPKKTSTRPSPQYINGCGAVACRCARPYCDGKHHACLCGVTWKNKEN